MKPWASHIPELTNPKRAFKARPYVAALVLSGIFWLLAWYGDTVQSMISTWRHSETFAHGFLIVPISACLAWRRRHAIRAHYFRPNLWMLLPLGMAGFVWLLGYLATVVVVQQYSLVVMILLLITTIVGTQIVKLLAFPLFFLIFAVPFGEVLLPIMMDYTADFTVFALTLTGIPVYREGLYFTVPSGNWSVVEACSGLRYLIASVTLGVLYAYLTYRTLKRRVIFVVLSIVAPIFANWLRAYVIVMIGHLSSMQHAVGVDHLIYGWLFFGVVMFVLFWVGSFWREDEIAVDAIPHESEKVLPMDLSVWKALLVATVASAGVAAVPPTVAAHLQGGPHQQPVVQVPEASGKWQIGSSPLVDWKPQFINPGARVREVYVSGTERVELYIGFYRNQRQGAQLISSQNALVHSSDKLWAVSSEAQRVLQVDNTEVRVIETTLRGRETRLLVWHWYWIDGQNTSNRYWAKLLQAKSMLLGRGDNAAVIILSTAFDLSAAEGADRLQGFVEIMLPPVVKVLQSVR
jgi:exosortase A